MNSPLPRKSVVGNTTETGASTTGLGPAATAVALSPGSYGGTSGQRRLFVNIPPPDHHVQSKPRFSNNKIKTTKYTIITFLPKNLFEQFRRFANVFFLILTVMQFFDIFTVIEPIIAALPLIFVLCFTALKDAMEDYRRHSSDKKINSQMTSRLTKYDNVNIPFIVNAIRSSSLVKGSGSTQSVKAKKGQILPETRAETVHTNVSSLSNLSNMSPSKSSGLDRKKSEWERIPWELVSVGDIIKIQCNEQIPADIIVLSSSETDGICYVETKNLDGETNLKIRSAVPETNQSELFVKSQFRIMHGVIDYDTPTAMLHSFKGTLHFFEPSEDEEIESDNGENSDPEDERESETKPLKTARHHQSRASLIFAPSIRSNQVSSTVTSGRPSREPASPVSATRSNTSIADKRGKSITPIVIPVSVAPKSMQSHIVTDRKTSDDGLTPKALKSEWMVSVPLQPHNLVLRGCILRDTRWIIGIPIYTGAESKLRLNSGETPSKVSMIEKQMNYGVLVSLILLVSISAVTATLSVLAEQTKISQKVPWYSGTFTTASTNSLLQGFIGLGVAIILYQNLVPISLYITVEICKSIQSYLIYQDLDMYDENVKEPCIPRSWNLADDLGQIDYIFTDKTGTLTQNKMEFRHCSIQGQLIGLDVSPVSSPSKSSIPTSPSQSKALSNQGGSNISHSFKDVERAFWTCLSVCHTVLISGKDNVNRSSEPSQNRRSSSKSNPEDVEVVYKAQSPDEAALVKAAKDYGYSFISRDSTSIVINVSNNSASKSAIKAGTKETYELLNVLDFNSARKRMSVIVRTPANKILLMCKGADTVIFERIRNEDTRLVDVTTQHLEQFAAQGFRTLCIAQKYLDDSFYQQWAKQYNEASVSMTNREEEIDRLSELIEKDLTLLGATAIEDKLQDGVPEAIHSFLQAGIRMWVLTGDKIETAINIGHSCHLLEEDMTIITIRGGNAVNDQGTTFQQIKEALEIVSRDHSTNTDAQYSLVIDGLALFHALDHPQTTNIFVELATMCKTVLCCRVSPLQKAKVVELIKTTQDAMCLAIGDGANDVGMIQAAHIGIGIAGEEGMQAANASDYAIGQFRFLKKLMLVHGHWCYLRFSEMVLNFLYKNVAYTLPLFFFQLYCAWAGDVTYDFVYMILFNVVFSGLPVLVLGSFDQDIDSKTILQTPQIYAFGPHQQGYTFLKSLVYIGEGLLHGAAGLFLLHECYSDSIIDSNGYTEDIPSMNLAASITMFSVINIFVLINLQSVSFLTLLGAIIPTLLLFAWVPLYGIISTDTSLWQLVFPRLQFWLFYILLHVIVFLPRMIFRSLIRILGPTDLMILQEQELLDRQRQRTATVDKKPRRFSSMPFQRSRAPAANRPRLVRPPSRTLRRAFGRPTVSGRDLPTSSPMDLPEVLVEDTTDWSMPPSPVSPITPMRPQQSNAYFATESEATPNSPTTTRMLTMAGKQFHGFSFSTTPGTGQVILGGGIDEPYRASMVTRSPAANVIFQSPTSPNSKHTLYTQPE